MKINILVTGGCGFIGSSFLDLLFDSKKFNIINIDKLTYASNSDYSKIKKVNYEFIRGDIVNQNLIKNVLKKYSPRYIFNFAAESHVDNSIYRPKKFLETNIFGTYSILKNIIDLGLKNKTKFVQISTDEVFGDRLNKLSSNEKSTYEPSSPYSASKAAADHMVTSWSRTYGLKYLITYSTNNYGPRQHKEKFIPKVIQNCIEKKSIPIYGSGNQKRDWIFVQDNAKAILKIGTSSKINDKFNIPGSKAISNLTLAKKICSIFDKRYNKNNFIHSSLIKHVIDRKGHDVLYSLCKKKFLKNFNIKPKLSFEKGLIKTIEHLAKN